MILALSSWTRRRKNKLSMTVQEEAIKSIWVCTKFINGNFASYQRSKVISHILINIKIMLFHPIKKVHCVLWSVFQFVSTIITGVCSIRCLPFSLCERSFWPFGSDGTPTFPTILPQNYFWTANTINVARRRPLAHHLTYLVTNKNKQIPLKNNNAKPDNFWESHKTKDLHS